MPFSIFWSKIIHIQTVVQVLNCSAWKQKFSQKEWQWLGNHAPAQLVRSRIARGKHQYFIKPLNLSYHHSYCLFQIHQPIRSYVPGWNIQFRPIFNLGCILPEAVYVQNSYLKLPSFTFSATWESKNNEPFSIPGINHDTTAFKYQIHGLKLALELRLKVQKSIPWDDAEVRL